MAILIKMRISRFPFRLPAAKSFSFLVYPSLFFFWLAFWAPILLTPVLSSAAGESEKNPPTPVVVAKAVEKNVAEKTTLVGSAEASAKSTVACEVSGIVTAFMVNEGDRVDKGRVLVRLNDQELKLRLRRAEAQKNRILANLELAKKELDRVEKLKQTDAVALRKYDEALFAHKALVHELDAAVAEMDLLKYEISQKTVTAPFAGHVSRTHTEVGEWIGAGGPVATILRLDPIRVVVDLPERYAISIRKGSSTGILIPSVSDTPFQGHVTAVLPKGNPDARTFPVHIEMDNPQLKIKDGMAATATLSLDAQTKAILVPKDAVVTAGENRLIYLVKENKATPLNIKVLGYYGGLASIEGPVRPDDLVVIRGNERLRPGQEVAATAGNADGS